jgi:hypothetical protein
VKHEGFTYNWPVLGPMPGFRISKDCGKTWTPSPLSPDKPLFPEPKKFMGSVKMGCPHFVDFGKNMEHLPDGKIRGNSMGADAIVDFDKALADPNDRSKTVAEYKRKDGHPNDAGDAVLAQAAAAVIQELLAKP